MGTQQIERAWLEPEKQNSGDNLLDMFTDLDIVSLYLRAGHHEVGQHYQQQDGQGGVETVAG